jgi:hypothetical protein
MGGPVPGVCPESVWVETIWWACVFGFIGFFIFVSPAMGILYAIDALRKVTRRSHEA